MQMGSNSQGLRNSLDKNCDTRQTLAMGESGGVSDGLWVQLIQGAEGLWAAERGRVILWTPVLIAVGIGLYFSRLTEPGWQTPAIVLALLVSAAILLPRGPWRLLAWAGILVALGFLAALLRTADVAAPIVGRTLRPMTLVGKVDAVEWRGPKEARLEISVLSLDRLPENRWPARVRLSSRTSVPADLRAGDRITTRVTLWPPPSPTMPGDFDFGRDLFFARIGALGFTLSAIERLPDSSLTEPRQNGLMGWVDNMRETVSKRIHAALPGETGALGDAFVTGFRAAIPKPLNMAMRNAGLSHLIAISGLHMSMVVGVVFLAVRGGFALWETVALRYPIKKWAALLAGFIALAYLGLSGASIPAQRSFLMAALMLIAVLLDRMPLSMRFVAAAAAFLLLYRPESLLSVSFQMSFGAVFALIAIYGELGHWRERRRAVKGEVKQRGRVMSGLSRIMGVLGGIILSSVIAECAVAPAALYHFHQVAIYGMVANLIAIPLTGTLIMPFLVLGVLLMPLGLEAWPLKVAGFGLDIVIRVAETVSSQPGATVGAPAFSVTAYVLFMLGGLWLLLWRTRWRLAGFGMIAGGLLMAARPAPPDMIIAGEGEIMALRAPDGSYWMSPGRKGSFVRERWASHTASDTHRWAWTSDGGAGDWLRCDSIGCIYRPRDGLMVAVVHDAYAFAEDCQEANLLISVLRAPRACVDQTEVIDRAAQRKNGGHSVNFLADGHGGFQMEIRSVGETRNGRPWGGKLDR
ncbi:ComEC/Rec2 family competence protein [Govanella unica]|uniref:ComEC family competence protein n=1 Tax=Govanella unica TaxID=2975056 RepID=A0A9X3Z720_9PROT|nr:ComEC/Rec2 family competence protein [Govania unica]MDA5193785.1 ComEC family competence protein [Govania unica]